MFTSSKKKFDAGTGEGAQVHEKQNYDFSKMNMATASKKRGPEEGQSPTEVKEGEEGEGQPRVVKKRNPGGGK